MRSRKYEYRDGALWVSLEGLGTPSETHANLLEALTVVLAEVESHGYRDGFLFPLYGLLGALLPTDEHLKAGWQAEVENQGQTEL